MLFKISFSLFALGALVFATAVADEPSIKYPSTRRVDHADTGAAQRVKSGTAQFTRCS